MSRQSLIAALSEPLDALARRDLAPVEVAVLDTGVDATHPDLAGRVVAAYRVALEGDRPRVQEAPSGANQDLFGHGTAVASIIARVAHNARLVDVRVLDDGNLGSGLALLAGLREVVDRGSRVVNMSLAATAEFAAPLLKLCEAAYRGNQVVVAAKRNMPLADNGWPAELSSCVAVDAEAFPSPFQLQFRAGNPIEYAAQGIDVPVAAPGGGYTTKTGTSFATPVTAGLVALLLGAYPDLRPFEVKTLLKAWAAV